MNFKVVSLSRANSRKMDLSSLHCVAMAKRKDNTRHKEHEEEPPSSGVDSKSSDDMIGESTIVINFTIPGMAVGAVIRVNRTTLQLIMAHTGCATIEVQAVWLVTQCGRWYLGYKMCQ